MGLGVGLGQWDRRTAGLLHKRGWREQSCRITTLELVHGSFGTPAVSCGGKDSAARRW